MEYLTERRLNFNSENSYNCILNNCLVKTGHESIILEKNINCLSFNSNAKNKTLSMPINVYDKKLQDIFILLSFVVLLEGLFQLLVSS